MSDETTKPTPMPTLASERREAVKAAKRAVLASREQVVSDTVAYLAKQSAADLEKITVDDDGDKAIAIVRGAPKRGIPAIDWVVQVSQSAEPVTETGPTSGPVSGEGD